MTPLTIAIVGVLAAWFLLTALVQLPLKWCKRIRRFDPVGHLLPGWSFFAPKPIRADFAVWYRWWECCEEGRGEVLEDGSSPWFELAGIEERRITDAVVNPARYTRKSIFTCCSRIMTAQRDTPGSEAPHPLPSDAVMYGLAYLMLLTKVTSLCTDSVAVQFRIDVVRSEHETPSRSTAFRSAIHCTVPASSEREVAEHVAAC